LFRKVVGYPSVDEREIASLIRQTKALRREKLWEAIGQNQALQDDLLLEHTYNSTSIEGTTFTKRQTEGIIFNKGTVPGRTLIEHLEVTSHSAVLREIFQDRLL